MKLTLEKAPMVDRSKSKKVDEMVPVFIMWAEKHGLNDAIKRFRTCMQEYQVLACVEKFTEVGDPPQERP